MDGYEGRRSPGVVIGCLVAFAAAMLGLRFVLHQAVPVADAWADQAVGPTMHGLIVLAVIIAAAFFGYRPLVRRWLAERR